MTTFTSISGIRNWVDSATANWDDRTTEQVERLTRHIRDNTGYGRSADEFLAALPDNLADLLND